MSTIKLKVETEIEDSDIDITDIVCSLLRGVAVKLPALNLTITTTDISIFDKIRK